MLGMWAGIVSMSVAMTIALSSPVFAENVGHRPEKGPQASEGTRLVPAAPPVVGLGVLEDFIAVVDPSQARRSETPPHSGTGDITSGPQRVGSLGPTSQPPGMPTVSQGSPEGRYQFLEIEVSHSAHQLKLMGNSPSGGTEVLHHCKVGLGGQGFPTPVGVYFVTHIYPEDPWWIPPRDRAWAAGQSPSRKVYGGVMAPLLKKRPVTTRKKAAAEPEDYVSGEMKLNDDGYRFHGTNAPRSIGHNQSHGCVRMLPEDAKKLASLIIEYTGVASKQESENGSFVILRQPVRLNLVK
jgi:hypothetical protein